MTHLYLQNNMIQRIEGLNFMVNLTKLYIGFNKIIVLENLEKCTKLKELHVEYQEIPAGEKMLLDPRTLIALSSTLMVLNISGNNIESIRDILILSKLTQLSCKDNQLTSMTELSKVLSSLGSLWKFDIEGNPLCRKPKFRDRIIVMTQSVSILDGKEVTETSRKFLQNWRDMRDKRKRGSKSDAVLPPIDNVIKEFSATSKLQLIPSNGNASLGDPSELKLHRRGFHGSPNNSNRINISLYDNQSKF